jgi:hypothetical protein
MPPSKIVLTYLRSAIVSEVERPKKAITFLTEWAIAKALRGVSKGAATKADRFSI